MNAARAPRTFTPREFAMRRSRWILIGSILGSGAVFVEGTVTTVALPAIARDFHLGIAGLQWVMNGYLLTLSALILLGGSLGDRFSRRRAFASGLIGFAVASLGCAIAPTVGLLVVCRILQGVSGALVVPNSLALLETAFTGEARGAAIGRWAAWSAVSTALGPLVGGWLVDSSWRLVFLCVAPLAIAAAVAVNIGAPACDDEPRDTARVDYLGAALGTLGLSGLIIALIAGPDGGFTRPFVLVTGVGGILLIVSFLVVEGKVRHPLLPLGIFRSRQFSGVNATTLVVYAALNALFLFLMLQLQSVLRYSPVAAGASLLPIFGLMLMFSPLAGRVAERRGPRLPMVVGCLTAGAGSLLFIRVRPGANYATTVLPAAVVFGLGLACFVAPLTSVALGALDERLAGLASGVNNAVARLAGLLATAVIPLAIGLGGARDLQADELAIGFARTTIICAVLCVAGSVVAALTIGDSIQPREAP
jgi:EmrB/QacA subfamily drug resistance transporter